MLRRQLRTVGPVDLIPVILLGVVAPRDVQAGRAAIITDRKAQLRRGTQRVKDSNMDTVCGHNRGSLLREGAAVEAAVMRNGNALGLGLLALGCDHVRKSLRRMTDDIHVHVMQTHLHCTAQTGRAELKRGIEAAFDFFLVVLDGVQLFPFLFAESRAVQPALILFLIVPHCFPPHIIALRHSEDFQVRRYPHRSR